MKKSVTSLFTSDPYARNYSAWNRLIEEEERKKNAFAFVVITRNLTYQHKIKIDLVISYISTLLKNIKKLSDTRKTMKFNVIG